MTDVKAKVCHFFSSLMCKLFVWVDQHIHLWLGQWCDIWYYMFFKQQKMGELFSASLVPK